MSKFYKCSFVGHEMYQTLENAKLKQTKSLPKSFLDYIVIHFSIFSESFYMKTRTKSCP